MTLSCDAAGFWQACARNHQVSSCWTGAQKNSSADKSASCEDLRVATGVLLVCYHFLVTAASFTKTRG